jgi:hypothetical protein
MHRCVDAALIRMGISARRPAQEVIDELNALRDIGVTS